MFRDAYCRGDAFSRRWLLRMKAIKEQRAKQSYVIAMKDDSRSARAVRDHRLDSDVNILSEWAEASHK